MFHSNKAYFIKYVVTEAFVVFSLVMVIPFIIYLPILLRVAPLELGQQL